MLLFVGLGNPTPDSENNRHNVGFKIIDTINKEFGLTKQKPKRESVIQLLKYTIPADIIQKEIINNIWNIFPTFWKTGV